MSWTQGLEEEWSQDQCNMLGRMTEEGEDRIGIRNRLQIHGLLKTGREVEAYRNKAGGQDGWVLPEASILLT